MGVGGGGVTVKGYFDMFGQTAISLTSKKKHTYPCHPLLPDSHKLRLFTGCLSTVLVDSELSEKMILPGSLSPS